MSLFRIRRAASRLSGTGRSPGSKDVSKKQRVEQQKPRGRNIQGDRHKRKQEQNNAGDDHEDAVFQILKQKGHCERNEHTAEQAHQQDEQKVLKHRKIRRNLRQVLQTCGRGVDSAGAVCAQDV